MIRRGLRSDASKGVADRRPSLLAVLSLIVTVCIGCGSPRPPEVPGPVAGSGPHGGSVYSIPTVGTVEIFTQPLDREEINQPPEAAVDKKSSPQAPAPKRTPPQKMLVAFFMQVDGKTPLKPPPTNVKAEFEPVPFRPVVCELSPLPDPNDPTTEGRFVYLEPLEQRAEVDGTLKGSFNGQPFEIRFAAQ